MAIEVPGSLSDVPGRGSMRGEGGAYPQILTSKVEDGNRAAWVARVEAIRDLTQQFIVQIKFRSNRRYGQQSSWQLHGSCSDLQNGVRQPGVSLSNAVTRVFLTDSGGIRIDDERHCI
jgi:hypothetical protein